MTGIDFDIEKIMFAKMMAEGERVDVKFEHAEVNLDYVDQMPEYDVISVMSMLHLKLVADKDSAYFWDLLEAISSKVKRMLLFEFPPHSYRLVGASTSEEFMTDVKKNCSFKSVEQIGISDAGRPMLKCLK
jgi:hypothetical protein